MKVTKTYHVKYDVDKFKEKLGLKTNVFEVFSFTKNILINSRVKGVETNCSYTYNEMHKLLGLPEDKQLTVCYSMEKLFDGFLKSFIYALTFQDMNEVSYIQLELKDKTQK